MLIEVANLRNQSMNCKHCGQPNLEGAAYCGSCGKPMDLNENSNTSSAQQKQSESKVQSSWMDSLNAYVGNSQPANLNWRVLFTDVFKSHTMEEAESIFICGTKMTTPAPSEVSKDWPHPWLYSRVFLTLFVATVLLWICVSGFSNYKAMPGMIVVGSFAVPIAVMILFLELNAWRNVSVFRVVQTFFVGGCASLATTLLLFKIYPVRELDYFGAFMTGVIEELGKAVIVYAFLRKLGKLSILTGMLVGASVGAGFSAFESAGYALEPLISFFQYSGYAAAYGQELDEGLMLEAINHSLLLRGFLSPGGHVAWAAVTGAGLVIAAKEKGVFSAKLFFERKFMRLFVIPIVLHGVWDCPLAMQSGAVFHIALSIIVWIVVLILINMGLAEVNQESFKENQTDK